MLPLLFLVMKVAIQIITSRFINYKATYRQGVQSIIAGKSNHCNVRIRLKLNFVWNEFLNNFFANITGKLLILGIPLIISREGSTPSL